MSNYIIEYVFSDEGLLYLEKFKEKFKCRFGIDEPGGEDLLIDVGDDTYIIPNQMTMEEFKKLVDESIKADTNKLIIGLEMQDYDENLIY